MDFEAEKDKVVMITVGDLLALTTTAVTVTFDLAEKGEGKEAILKVAKNALDAALKRMQ